MTVVTSEELETYQSTPEELRRTMFQCASCKKWFSDEDIYDKHNCVTAMSNEGKKCYFYIPFNFISDSLFNSPNILLPCFE